MHTQTNKIDIIARNAFYIMSPLCFAIGMFAGLSFALNILFSLIFWAQGLIVILTTYRRLVQYALSFGADNDEDFNWKSSEVPWSAYKSRFFWSLVLLYSLLYGGILFFWYINIFWTP